jgi:polysaccharide export outer membrane protein
MPGSYPYRYGASVLSAIALAGGVAVLEQMQGTSISDFLFADERLRILESTRRALIIRRARLEAQRDGARTFEALLTVSTPLGVPRNRSADARSVCIVQSGLSAAKLLGSSRGRLQAPQDLPDPCGRLRRFERGAWGL